MKIDRKKIFNRCGFDQRECYDLAVRLAALNENDLISEIKKINVWHYGKCELGLWADVLDRLDTILAEGVTKVGQWTLKLDQPGNEHLIGKIIAILEFTGHLIEHSIYRYLYGSWEHILALFGTSNMDILHALLGLFYNFSKRSNYFSRLDSTNRKIVLERLNSIAENWGGKQHGFGLAECCVTEYMPYSAGTMQYEFMQDVSPSSTIGKKDCNQTTGDLFVKPKCHRRKLTLRNLHLQPESPSELMENLIQKYNLTNTSDQMALFARLRLCVYFGKPEQRKLLIYTRMQALSILCYTNEVEDKCLSWDIVEELVDVLKLPDREFLGIKACALRTLTAIIHCGKLTSCWPVLKNMTGMNSYHGHFPTMMREWITDLVQSKFQPFASTVEQMYTTAILSFLYHLACTNEVNSTSTSDQGNLVGTGLLDSMKEIIMWHTHEPDYISFATRAVRVTDQILLSFQLNGNSTNQKSTIDAIVDRLKFEIKICLESEIDETTKKSIALNTQRVGFIKSMLNLIKRLILDNEWSDTLQSTMDGELPDILRLIFKNYTTKFNPQLCLFSMEVITNFVYNHPSSMSVMQERQLTKDILKTLTDQPLPVNRDFLVTLPTLLSALSINVRGINEIKESKIIDKYIKTLTDSRFVTAMRNKRIREMMTPSESADTATTNHSHPSTPTSYQMSNAMNELARANAVVFKPIIYEAICKAFKTVTHLGQKQPAPLLGSAKPNTIPKNLHRNNNEHNRSNVDDNEIIMPQQQIVESQEMAGPSGVMFSNENNQADLLAVMNAVEEADREVEQIMEMSGDEDDGVADNEMTQAIDAEEDRTPSDGCGKENKTEEMNQFSCDDDAMYLMDYICNVCKFMERFMSDQQPEHSLRNQIYSEEGLKTILDILTIPSLPYDFPSSPACQSMQKIFEYLLSWATSTDAILIYQMFYKISRKIGDRLQKLEQPQIYSILLKDYVNRTEEFLDSSGIVIASKTYWEENGVCLLHDLVILSTVVVIYEKITDRLPNNLRQDILVELKSGIIDYARWLPLLNWEAMVLMNLLFEDEEACLEDLKRLCINERGTYLDNDHVDEHSFLSKKSSLSTCQQLFSDNPRSEKIIKRMLQITQKAANDMIELLVTLTKFCCVKPDYSYVVRVRYNRVNGSIPTGKNKMALLNKIAEHCKSLLERESPYTMQSSQDSWPEDPHSELPVDKACQKILSDIKFLHPMKYFCFTTIHRILTGGDLQKKPFLGFFYAFQMNNGLEVFFECANELLDTIKYIQYLDPATNSSVKIMLESFLITVDRMTQIRRISQEFVDSTDKELRDRFDIDLYQRMIRAYMLEPISKLFSFSSLDIDLLNNQSQESLMNIIAFLTSYIFDRDTKKPETEEVTEETIAFNDEHEQMINQHINFIMELGFSRDNARRALERNDYDPTQAVSSLFNTDLGLRMTETNTTPSEPETSSKSSRPPNLLVENSREISAIETRLKELEMKNASIKDMIKESFLINLFNLQKEKGIDIITRIVDILLLTGQINEFLEKILAVNGCSFLTNDDAYSSILRTLILNHYDKEISGANIEDSPNGLHILTLLYNKIRFQVTASFKNHDMVTRLVKMTNHLFKAFMAVSPQTEEFKTSVLKHITQLWLIIDQYERTAFALRIRKDVIYEYHGCPTWFWIDDRHGIWHPVSAQHNANINRSYRNGQLKAYSKPNSNNEYVFNFVSLTQKNEESQTERPIMLLPIKSKDQRKPDNLSDYESKIISCVPDPLGDEEVIELSDNMLQFLISIKKIDNVYKWDCLQAACYLLIRLCDKYRVANERLAAYKSAIPRLCTIPHHKGYTQQLVTFVMTLLRQQFETPQLLKQTISDILDKNIPKGACVLHKTTSFNDKLSKDLFYFVWDSIPLLVRDFETTMNLMSKKIELNSQTEKQLLKSYTISKSPNNKLNQPPMELEKKQIAIVRFLVESALSFYIEKNDVWCELFKKLKLNTEYDLKTMISSQNYLLETHTVVTSNLDNTFSSNQHATGTVKNTYKLTGKEFLNFLGELIFSYEQVGAFTINLRLFNRPISFYLVNIYLQEACALLDSMRSKEPGSTASPSFSREQNQFQQLVSLQIIEAFLLTVKESYDVIISEIVRNLKMRSHHKDGDCRNTYIVVIMKLLNDLITRLPVAISKKLVILMYKYRLPNDLCRLLSVVDCSVVQHKSVLVDVLTVIDSLCRPDRQMFINKRQRSSKSNIELLNKRQRRLNNSADVQVSSSVVPGTSATTNEINSQEMETDDVFYVDINAWSRNSRTENSDNTAVDNLETLDTSNADEHPVDVDDDEEMDDYDEVDGVMMSEFRDIDAEYDFDEPQMYDDDNNTESETDYEEIEEDEGSAGSQDGDSQGDRFDEDIRETENTTHNTGRQEQSRRIFQILNHNYYNISQDSENTEIPRHDPESSIRDRLSNVLMTSTFDHQPSYVFNEGFSLDAPSSQEDTNTFRLADNLYFVTNSREYDVSSQPSNYYPNDLAGCANATSNNLIRTSSLESPSTSQNNQTTQPGSQEDSVNGRGWRGLTYAPGARYMRLEARTLRQNTIRNILTLNRGSFIDRAPNTRSPSNRFVDTDLSLDSLEADFEMQEILGRAMATIPSGWNFLINPTASAPPSTINNFTFTDISMITNFRRWIVEARTLYGREITDLVMLARARVYQAVFSKLPEVSAEEKDSLSLKVNLEKIVDNIIDNGRNGIIDEIDSRNISMEHDLMIQPDIMIESLDEPNETVIGEEMITPTPSESMEIRDEPVIDNIEIDQSNELISRVTESIGAAGGGAGRVGAVTEINDDDTDNLSMEQLLAEGIDPSFLEALPPSMRREVIIEHRRANRVRQQLTGVQLPENVDAEIMAQLPPHIQEEILAHYRRESTVSETNTSSIGNVVTGAESNSLALPTTSAGVVDSSFLLSLAPSLRREILADMDQSQIANLSSELADEARQVRQETGDAQMRALQANLLSVTGRRRARQLTSGLSDLLSQMNRGRWDQRNIRYVVFSERNQTNRHNNPTTNDTVTETGEWPNLSAYKPLVSTDGLTNLIALLITSSTTPCVMKMISTLVNKILQSLTCHPQIRAWISCTIVNILLKISLPKENSDSKPKIFSSPSNSESSILCTPIGSGSCTDISRSSSIQDDTFRQYPNNKSLFFHSFERGFALTDQVFVPSTSKIYKHKNKSGIQSLEMPEVTIHESVSGSVAKALIESLSTISSMHTKEFYPTSQSKKVPTNFWFTLAWYMSLKTVSLEDQCPETHLPPNEEYDYFTHLLCLVRLPLMQTNNAMLEKLLLTIHNILKAYYKSFNVKEKSVTEWSNSLQNPNPSDGDHNESSLPPVLNESSSTIKDKVDSKTCNLNDPHLNRVNVKTISHLVNIICAKECSNQTPLPTDKCRMLSERLLIELSKGNANTKQDIIRLLTSNIETILETLTGVLHKVLNEAVMILERECNEACINEASGSSASPIKKSSTFTESIINDILPSNLSPSYDIAFTSANPRRNQSQVSSGYSRNNSLPHIAFNQLKMESIKPFTANTGDHLNLLDLFNLLRKVDNSILVQFQSPSSIWTLLSQVLDAIQKSKEPDAVIVFQSLVESFLLCHSDTNEIQEEHNKSEISTTTDPLSHLNTTLVVDDTFMNSPAFSENGKHNPFLEFVEKHKKVLNHILRRRIACTLDQSNFSALLKYPKLLDFDIKRRYFQAKVAQLRNDGDSRYEEELVQVSRARLFEDSYGRLHRKTAEEWKQRFCIKFMNEEGQDGGGLLREWYLKMSHEIFNPNYALFKVSPDGVTYTINPASYVNNNHLSYFKFVGRFIAKAIFDNKLLTCYFTRAFYKHILGISIRYTDLEKEDYQFFRGLEFLLKNDVSTMFLDQTFSIQISEFGQTETRDLRQNGSQILVTEENKSEYVRLVCQEKMTGAIRQQLHSFLEGFYEIIPKNLISIFNEKELELLICGLPEIDLNDLKVNTVYNKYTPASPQIQWFWQALESFDQEDRARFIQFVTGTSKVPLGGFSKLEGMNGPTKFQISLASMSTNHLPAAHTCFNSIDLPQYESYEKLRKCLLTAIRECSEGYGMI